QLMDYFEKESILPKEINSAIENNGGKPLSQSVKMVSVITRPEIKLNDFLTIERVKSFIDEKNLDREVLEQAEIQLKYKGYIEREKQNADKLKRLEDVKIPKNFDYNKIKSLSTRSEERRVGKERKSQ